MKYRPVRQHRQLRPRWDHACSSTNPLRSRALVVSLALQPWLAPSFAISLARSLGRSVGPSTSLFLSSGSCLLLVFPARFLDSSSTLAAWRLPHERGFRWSFPGLTISICRPEGRRAELIRTAESRRWCRSERRLVLSFDPISVLSLSPFRSPARSSLPSSLLPPPPLLSSTSSSRPGSTRSANLPLLVPTCFYPYSRPGVSAHPPFVPIAPLDVENQLLRGCHGSTKL